MFAVRDSTVPVSFRYEFSPEIGFPTSLIITHETIVLVHCYYISFGVFCKDECHQALFVTVPSQISAVRSDHCSWHTRVTLFVHFQDLCGFCRLVEDFVAGIVHCASEYTFTYLIVGCISREQFIPVERTSVFIFIHVDQVDRRKGVIPATAEWVTCAGVEA